MKTTFKHLLAAATLTLSPFAFAHAQTSVTTTTTGSDLGTASTTTTQTTNSEGTIESFTPGSSQIVVRTSTGSPVTYAYSKKTTFVDADGNVVNSELIKAGTPTTVYYSTENGQPVVSRVVVRRAVAAPAAVTKTETSETTTTTTRK